MRRRRSRMTKRKCSRVAACAKGHSELRTPGKRKQQSACERIACAERVRSIERLDLCTHDDALRDGECAVAAELAADDAVARGAGRPRPSGPEAGERLRLGGV